jgi:hypothetical protein
MIPQMLNGLKKKLKRLGFECAVLSPGESFSTSVREKRGEQKIALQSN